MALMGWSATIVVVCCLITGSIGKNKIATTCPPYADSFPCRCNVVEEGITLDCQKIVYEGQLDIVFKRSFINETVYELTLRNCPLLSLTKKVFGSTSFVRIIIKDSSFTTIDTDVFPGSYTTLTYLELNSVLMSKNGYVFQFLSSYSKLITLNIENFSTTMMRMPTITSPYLKELRFGHMHKMPIDTVNVERLHLNWAGVNSLSDEFVSLRRLEYLSLRGNTLTFLDSSSFQFLSNVNYLDLSFNKISSLSISPGTFENFNLLQHLDLSHNELILLPEELKTLPNLQFLNVSYNLVTSLDSGTFSGNLNLNTIDLDHNNIQVLKDNSFSGMVKQNATIYLRSSNLHFIDPSAFGDISNSQIHLESNYFSILLESSLRPLLENDNFVYVDGNPYKCDCDFSWILDDPKFLSLLQGKCEDGTPFQELDSSHFQGC